MSEFLKKLQQSVEGRREKKWKPQKWTPKQLHDQIHGVEINSMEHGLAEFPPDDQIKAQKQEGLRRRHHSRKKR